MADIESRQDFASSSLPNTPLRKKRLLHAEADSHGYASESEASAATGKRARISGATQALSMPLEPTDLFDLRHYIEELKSKEQTLRASFPYNKNGIGRDAYTYNRVREQLNALKKLILHHGFRLASLIRCRQATTPLVRCSGRELWIVCLEFLNASSQNAQQLPEFDAVEHNLYKRDLLSKLAMLYQQVILKVPATELVPKNASILAATAKTIASLANEYPLNFGAVKVTYQAQVG